MSNRDDDDLLNELLNRIGEDFCDAEDEEDEDYEQSDDDLCVDDDDEDEDFSEVSPAGYHCALHQLIKELKSDVKNLERSVDSLAELKGMLTKK